jgi:hypothetical protein
MTRDAILPVMGEDLAISLSFGAWTVRRLLELRRDAGLPDLDLRVPFATAMPAGTDGATMTDGDVVFTLANRHSGPILDLPDDESAPFSPLRAHTTIDRTERRRNVPLAECHDAQDLLVEAADAAFAAGLVSGDTRRTLIDAAERGRRPFDASPTEPDVRVRTTQN